MIGKFFSFFKNILANHKSKIFTTLASAIVFIYLLFPFNDLGDFVGNKISAVTQGSLSVGFDTLDVGLLPPGLKLQNVSIDSAYAPSITSKVLRLSPNLAALFMFKMGFSAKAEGLFGGDVSVSHRETDKIKDSTMRRQKVAVDLSNVSLDELSKTFSTAVPLKGSLSGITILDIDPTFTEQPSGKINLNISDLKVVEGIIAQMGLQIPGIDLKTGSLEGTLEKGNLSISKLALGSSSSEVAITGQGQVSVKIQNSGLGMAPNVSNYDLNLKIQLTEAGKAKLATYLPFIAGFKVTENQYSIRIAGQSLYGPPSTLTKGM